MVSSDHNRCALTGKAGEKPALTRNRGRDEIRSREPDHPSGRRLLHHPSSECGLWSSGSRCSAGSNRRTGPLLGFAVRPRRFVTTIPTTRPFAPTRARLAPVVLLVVAVVLAGPVRAGRPGGLGAAGIVCLGSRRARGPRGRLRRRRRRIAPTHRHRRLRRRSGRQRRDPAGQAVRQGAHPHQRHRADLRHRRLPGRRLRRSPAQREVPLLELLEGWVELGVLVGRPGRSIDLRRERRRLALRRRLGHPVRWRAGQLVAGRAVRRLPADQPATDRGAVGWPADQVGRADRVDRVVATR